MMTIRLAIMMTMMMMMMTNVIKWVKNIAMLLFMIYMMIWKAEELGTDQPDHQWSADNDFDYENETSGT